MFIRSTVFLSDFRGCLQCSWQPGDGGGEVLGMVVVVRPITSPPSGFRKMKHITQNWILDLTHKVQSWNS